MTNGVWSTTAQDALSTAIHEQPLRLLRNLRGRKSKGLEISQLQVLLSLVGVALTLIGGYFLVMKLINMSRLEDCMLPRAKNCIPIELPRQTD